MRSGDSLPSIAQMLWGDATLWYKIAEANGLTASSSLTDGQSLTIPAGVFRNQQTAKTYLPYDQGRFLALAEPSALFPAPAAARKGCGAFGQILLVAIAVAVTVLTKGAFAKFAAGIIGKGIGATIIGGALAGAAGSVVSQGVGVATGIQDRFSFKGVALAAIGGGVGAGLDGVNAFGTATNLAKFGSDVVRGALGSVISQGIGVVTGLQDKFSWAGVAAAGVGAGIGGALGRAIGYNPSAEGFNVGNSLRGAVSGAASAIANAATRSAIDGSSFGKNLVSAIPDVIGAAIGQAVGDGILGSRSTAASTASPGLPPQKQEADGQVLSVPPQADRPTTGQAVSGEIVVNGARYGGFVDYGNYGFGRPPSVPRLFGNRYSGLSLFGPRNFQFARVGGLSIWDSVEFPPGLGNPNRLNFLNDPNDPLEGMGRGPFDALKKALEFDYGPIFEENTTPPPPVEEEGIVVTARRDGLSPRQLDYAYFSQAVYSFKAQPTEGGRRLLGAELTSVTGFTESDLFDSRTGLKAGVFIDRDGRVVLAFAGTESWLGPDGRGNVQNELGRLSEQHRQAIALGELLVQKLGVDNVAFTGHSLGGGLASLVALTTGAQAITFNPAGIPNSILSNLNLRRSDALGLVTAVTHRSDPLYRNQAFGPLTGALGTRVFTGTVFGHPGHHRIGDVINSLKKNLSDN